jgi:hypothetical protein
MRLLMTMTTPPKRKVTMCPTCGQPTHKDPLTGRFTKHPQDPGPIETGPLTRWRDTPHPELAGIPPREPEPERKRRRLNPFRRR